jgi:iron complex transport system substrate-binding protein
LVLARIVSLLPAATEIAWALGAGDDLVAVSHQCDYPPAAARLPRITTTSIDPALGSREIDTQVRALREAGAPVIAVDGRQLRALRPDLILTQDLCQVCAVADGEVYRLARLLDPAPRLITLSARDLTGIWNDIRLVGEAIGRESEAESLVVSLQKRMEDGPPPRATRPRVVCVEWLEPLYLAGHWVPELIRAAGGVDAMAVPGKHSVISHWDQVAGSRPDMVIVALCGFGMERALKELAALDDNHWLHSASCPVWVLDGNGFTSRAGPRVVEGAELIRSALQGIERPGLVRYERRYRFDTDGRGNQPIATDVGPSPT